MRIHIYCRSFAPAIGGVERLVEVLAREFFRMGHAVSVVTETTGESDQPYPVERQPGFRRYLALARAADVIVTVPLSLRRLPAQLLTGRRLVVLQPMLFTDAKLGRLLGPVKRFAARLVPNIVPSQYMLRQFPGATVIPNPYDTETFTWPNSDAPRTGLLFAGRLAPEKGCDLLLRALALLPAPARLTIIGEGPERAPLERLAAALGIAAQVEFRGPLTGPTLAAAMQTHRVLVVPTLCEEAFGIVALEGLACGCRMVVAESGGLPEAVGTLALTFPCGDVESLAARLETALGGDVVPPPRASVEAHLAQFTPERIAAAYLALLGAPTQAGKLAAAPQPQ